MNSLRMVLLLAVGLFAAAVIALVILRMTNRTKFNLFIGWLRPRIGEVSLGILASFGVTWAVFESNRRQRADDLEDTLSDRLGDNSAFLRGELKAEAGRVAERERQLGLNVDASKQREAIAINAIDNIKTGEELETAWRRYRMNRNK